MPKTKPKLKPSVLALLAEEPNTEGTHNRIVRAAPNLYMQRRENNYSWLMRWDSGGRTYWMGLGRYRDVTQPQVEAMVAKYMEVVRAGDNPRRARDEDRIAAGQPVRSKPTAKGPMTFRDVARAYLAKFEDQWKAGDHARQWAQTLRDYVYPVIGDEPVGKISVSHIVQVLEPLWRDKHVTAKKVRSRIALILTWAEAMEWRSGDNPARSKAVDTRLGNGVPPVKHFEAIPYNQLPGFWKALAEDDTVKGDATRFMILTAARANEALGATWDEIDLEQRIWTIPAERMKMPRAHRVPLSEQAIAVLEKRRALATPDDGMVFPGANGKPLHRSVPKDVIQRLRGTTETAHGCRSTFADWCRVVAKADPEARELALAHQIGNATTRSYSRDDLLEPRSPLMEAWGAFLAEQPAR